MGGARQDAARARHRGLRDATVTPQAVLLGPQRGLEGPRAAEPAVRAGQGRHRGRHAPAHTRQR